MRHCSCPSPSTGLDWRVLGGPGTWGTWNSWQVPQAELLWMRGQVPRGRGKAQGCAFLGVRPRRPRQGLGVRTVLGSPPVTAGALCSTLRGWGAGSPPGRAQGGCAACRTEQSSSEPAESKWEPCALQGPGRGTGNRHWFCSTKAGGSIPQSSCAQRCWGGAMSGGGQPLVLLTAGQAETHGQPVPLCHKSWGCQGTGSAWASCVGSQWVGGPGILGS